MTSRTRRVVSLLALGLLAACSGDSPASLTDTTSNELNTPPTGEPALRVIGEEQPLAVGETSTLNPASSISRWRFIWWYTSNSAVASVSRGQVTAVGEGTATVTALTWGGQQTWTVFAYNRNTASLDVTPNTLTLAVGEKSAALTTTLRTTAGERFAVSNPSYRIGNSAVATLDGTHVVGVSRGSTTLQVSALGMNTSVPVSVQSPTAPSPEAPPLPPTLATFELTPGGPLTMAVGAWQRFSATATWSDGATEATRSIVVRYSATGGSVDNLGNYQAPTAAGDYLVIGAPDGSPLRDTVRVKVEAPTITGFAISPRTASAAAGTTAQFAVVTTWSDGQARSTAVTYSAPHGGSVTSTGLFTAPATAGTYRVIAAEAAGTRRDTALVTVTAAGLTSLSLTPATASVPAGLTQQFAVSAQWTNGSTTVPPLAWSVIGGSGSVSASGLYTAPATPGTYRLVVAHAGGTLRDTATITVTAPTVTSLTVTPGSASLTTGGTRQFTASGLLSNGQTGTPAVTWSRIGSGSISSSGLYTAPSTAGTYRVVATLNGGTLADTAVVTVTAPTVTAFTLSPATVTLSAGQTRQFSTAVQWSDGASRAVSVTYQATGGTVTSAGLYSAGQVAGTFALIATCSCGAADTSAITISAPQLSSLTITPQTASIQTGAQQQFGATAQWTTGSTTLPPVGYSVIGGSANGTVNSTTGLYTAPSTAGTYRVVVAHTGGTLRDTATVTVTGTTAPPPPPTTSFTPNLPSGLSLVTDSYFGNLLPGEQMNADGLAHAWDGRNATDNAAPFGPHVYEMFYAGNIRSAGDGGGILWGPERRQWRRVYFSLMVWVPSNYSMHSGGEKFFYPLVRSSAGTLESTSFGWDLVGADTPNGSTFGFVYDAQIGDGRVYQPTSSVRVRKGEWQRIEFYVVMNTPGSRNGIWQVWVNGQQVINKTDARFSASSAQAVFDGIRFTGTRGGGQSNTLTPPGGQVRRYSRLAFYASNN